MIDSSLSKARSHRRHKQILFASRFHQQGHIVQAGPVKLNIVCYRQGNPVVLILRSADELLAIPASE